MCLRIFTLRNKIHGNYFLRYPASERNHFLVLRMIAVKIQRFAIGINGNQAGIERTLEMQHI